MQIDRWIRFICANHQMGNPFIRLKIYSLNQQAACFCLGSRLAKVDNHLICIRHDLVLITNVPVRTAHDAQTVYTEWRYRPQIEHTYRFDQEDGLDVEDVRVQTWRMRRIFALLLLAAMFVYHVSHAWPRRAVLWLRRLGGKLGLSDRDGPYVLLAGIRAVFVTAATLAFAARYPFPRGGGTCG